MSYQEGPYLIAALTCEKVLEEKDGVKSAIRIIDRLTRTEAGPNPPKTMKPFEHVLCLFVRLKSGSVRGVYPLKIVFVNPGGDNPPPLQVSANFEGEEDRGVDLVAELHARFEVPGIYWIEVFLEDRFLTRIPFRVVYIPQITQIGPSGTGGFPSGSGTPPRD